MSETILSIENLRIHFETFAEKYKRFVEESEVRKGETLALVGESGSGKSGTAKVSWNYYRITRSLKRGYHF